MLIEIVGTDGSLFEIIEVGYNEILNTEELLTKLKISYGEVLVNNQLKVKVENKINEGDSVIIKIKEPVCSQPVPRTKITADVFTIDPEGCTDADDAFSIWEEEGQVHLMIHIADPTDFISDSGELFKHIIKTAQTQYPFGAPPVHLFPDEILQRASLVNGSNKKTISVHAVFEQGKLKLISTGIEFCLVDCDSCSRFTYEKAAESDLNIFILGTEIAKQLWKDRSKHMSWVTDDLNLNLSLTIPHLNVNGGVSLTEDSLKVKVMKSMIAEFAILANTVFAKGLSDRNIFLRSAQLTDEIKTCVGLTGQNLLHKIIEQSVSASYVNEMLPHDIVTGDIYTHATSPLRRASDCIVHMLLKAQALNKEAPFNSKSLLEWSIHLTNQAKKFKKEQHAEIKKATLRWISSNLPVSCILKVMSHKAGFVNLMITELNKMPVNVSYTLRRKDLKSHEEKITVELNTVNFNCKYDEGTLPDIDYNF